jgi:hypothetical protein
VVIHGRSVDIAIRSVDVHEGTVFGRPENGDITQRIASG